MRLEVQKDKLIIFPETPQDVAYIVYALGLFADGQEIRAYRCDSVPLRPWDHSVPTLVVQGATQCN